MPFTLSNSDLYSIFSAIIATLGYLKLFEKCGIEKKYAFIPIYRFYKIAEFLEMDEEGGMYLNMYITYGICVVAMQGIEMLPRVHVRTQYFLEVFFVIVSIAALVYEIRISREMCRNMNMSRRWLVFTLFAEYILILVWGLSKKYQPARAKQYEAAGESGYVAKNLGDGLTVNIEARSVKKGFKKRNLLKDIHLNINPGKMVLLLGGSGAGKTTFLNAVTGYEKADAEILLDGSNVYKNYDRLKYKIGFVPQQDLIRYEDTVLHTLNDAAKMRLATNFSSEQRKHRVEMVMDQFGLTPVKDNMVGQQSGGQKKRISIATEFIADPSLFILDEPDSGLDGILAKELMQRLHEISREGKIVIVITHTPDRVIEMFDEVIVLGKDANRTGRLVYHGSIQDAREFFEVETMEEIVRKINRKEEGGEGLADELIDKYREVCHEQSAS